ncbi:FAD-dependent oxidoreductase [Phytoactinopolyspora mesophila]|uniref:FAD-dependent oxidoreductase n=1 Tax=Phytoactinopolyspora mesophila TaxID=2650750 RepID=A0A7K3MBZ9_9ACTN|nr:FAD-dependent oxidoreductase [Phytoactinopolyspora mesophila]NDL60690.1 FAD-dependent oxidoreductase [Phytoactinopolyspora mesophila]
MKAIIIGGGIGGLCAATALAQRGWDVEVLERAAQFTEVGAGLSLWPNALRALDALGLGDSIRERALMSAQAGIRTASGSWLSRTDTDELERRFGRLAMVHRADILDILSAAAPSGSLRAGVTVHEVQPDGTVLHTDGVSTADLVVAADGIHSIVRRSVWPDAPSPRYAGYTAWRMVTEPMPIDEGVESWGRGQRVGYAQLPDGRVYCYATASAPEGTSSTGLAELRQRFGDWHEPIPALLDATADDAVLHHDIHALPPLTTYVSDKIALLGDAAHAMTPNLGQGACQALEDAVVLAGLLAGSDSVASALKEYDHARRPRTQMIARSADRIGSVGQWSSPPAVVLRNAAMRLAPASSFYRSLAPILNWSV